MASVADQVSIALERARMEEALERANQELETRVWQRTEELRRANTALERGTRQLRNLAGELSLAEQRERRRLAGMLHDHLQQLLVSARYQVESLKSRGGEPLRESLDRVDDLIGQSIEESRTLTAELSPPVLHSSGLGPLLEWLSRWIAGKHNLGVDLRLPPELPAMAEDVAVQLFQSTRELLFNVVKHAQADRAVLEVEVTVGTLALTVSDQGVGFDPGRLGERSGTESFGLFSIRERLNLIGGTLAIRSAPGQGSRFTVSVPVASLGGAVPSPDAPVGTAPARPLDRTIVDAASKVRVLLVDDLESSRNGLAQLLASEEDLEVVGEAGDGESAVALATRLKPDVVVMDVSMPGMNGIEATRRRKTAPPTGRLPVDLAREFPRPPKP
jgi:signal transduction histidine kinase